MKKPLPGTGSQELRTRHLETQRSLWSPLCRSRGSAQESNFLTVSLKQSWPIINCTFVFQCSMMMELDGLFVVIINKTSQFMLRFTFWVVHSLGSKKCIISSAHNYSITQKRFTAQKMLGAPIRPAHRQPLTPLLLL